VEYFSGQELQLNPVVEKLREELLKDKYLHADETPVQVLNEKDKKNTTKSYMWVYSTSVNAKHGIRIFKYTPGRSGDNAKEFLKGFNGYLHTDEFSGYEKVLPKSNIGKALQYALNHKEKLEIYLEAENSIRPFTVGRKNWTFCGNPEGLMQVHVYIRW